MNNQSDCAVDIDTQSDVDHSTDATLELELVDWRMSITQELGVMLKDPDTDEADIEALRMNLGVCGEYIARLEVYLDRPLYRTQEWP